MGSPEIVYILVKGRNQSEYTEPRYWASAEDSCDIIAVFKTHEAAAIEKTRLEKEDAELVGALDTDPCYFDIRTFRVL